MVVQNEIGGRMKGLIVLIVIFWSVFVFGQEVNTVYQTPFEDGISSILVGPNQQHYITTEGDISTFGGLTVKLWDFKSKLLVTQKWFESENGPGSGEVKLLNNGVFFISFNHSIVKVDIVSNVVDTVFIVEYPEYIHTYSLKNEVELIVATKSYGEKHEEITDITNIGSLYRFNLTEKEIKMQKKVDFEYTYLKTFDNRDYFLAGTNKGECLFLNNSFENFRQPVDLYKKSSPRFLAITKDSILIANAAVGEKKYFKLIGEPRIDFFDLRANQGIPKLDLELTDVPKYFDTPFDMQPSNNVKEITYKKKSNILYVSYGYSSIKRFNLSTSKEKTINITHNTETIHSLIETPEEDIFFIIHDKATIFEMYNQFSIIDLKSVRKLNTIKNKKEALIIDSKFFPIEEDYYFISKTNLDRNSFIKHDTLLIRNKSLTPQTVVICEECEILMYDDNSTWIVKSEYDGVSVIRPSNKLLNLDTLLISHERIYETKEMEISCEEDLSVISSLDFYNGIFKKKRINQFKEYIEKFNCYLVVLEKGKYDSPKKFIALLEENGELIQEIEIDRLSSVDVEISKNNETIIISEYDYDQTTKFLVFNRVNGIWDVTINEIVTNGLTNMQLNPDGTTVIIQRSKESEELSFDLVEYNLPNFKNENIIHSGLYYESFFVDKKRGQLYNYGGDYLYQVNLKTNKVVKKTYVNSSSEEVVYYDALDQLLFTFSDRNIQFNLNENTYTKFFLFENNEAIISTEKGHYLSQGNQHTNFAFAVEDKAYPFSQFDLKYNRPDIVLATIGTSDKNVINSYKKAYDKRLQKMGLSNYKIVDEFHLPVISINEKSNSFQTENDITTLNISSSDSKYSLDRVNVWINNVPIYGVNGISLRSKVTQDFDTTFQLQLNEGDNKIEVSVLNQAGAGSYKETIYISCTKPAPKPNLYFVGIGVKDYADQNMNLKFSDKDIRDVANMYGKNKSYGEIYIDTFLNASVTKDILPQIRKRLESSTIHDQVIFMYSGHGILDDSLDYFLTTYDIDFFNPKEKGIPYEAVDALMDNIPARKKLVLIDACNSGEVDKDELEVENTDSDYSGVTAEAIGPKGDLFKKYTTKTNSFEMMQELFTDLRRGTGATVISSSSGKYFSFEDKKYQNGVYTYALKLGLEGEADRDGDGEITVTELKEFLYSKVEELTHGKQKPTARQENLEYDYRVW